MPLENDKTMTEQEEQELKRLEVNTFRLRELILKQQEVILSLQKALREKVVELEACRVRLAEAEHDRDIRLDAIAFSTMWGADALAHIDEMIKEVSCCIEQLEAEE